MSDNHTSSDREPAIPASMASFYNTELARKAQEFCKAPLNPLTMFPAIFHYLKSCEKSSRSLGVTDIKTGQVGKLFQNESDLWVEIPSQPQTTRCMVASYPNRFYLTPESAEKIARHFLENELRDVAQRSRGSFGAMKSPSNDIKTPKPIEVTPEDCERYEKLSNVEGDLSDEDADFFNFHLNNCPRH